MHEFKGLLRALYKDYEALQLKATIILSFIVRITGNAEDMTSVSSMQATALILPVQRSRGGALNHRLHI